MIKLAIIGTAGRKDDAPRLAANAEHFYRRMLDCARVVAEKVGADTLVSGGAAWADFMAIALFLESPDRFRLLLELPETLSISTEKRQAYLDTGEVDWVTNPGGTSNHYLRQFARQCHHFMGPFFPWVQYDTVSCHVAVVHTVTRGFKARNTEVAKADHCLAMTFGDGHQLKDGGTAHTMGEFLARPDHGQSYHLDLNTLKLYANARI